MLKCFFSVFDNMADTSATSNAKEKEEEKKEKRETTWPTDTYSETSHFSPI